MNGTNIYRWITTPLLIAILFSYYSIYDIRLLPLFLGISVLAVIFRNPHFRITASVDFYGLMVVYCLIASIFSMELEVLTAMVIFGWLVYWPIFIRKRTVLLIDVECLLRYVVNLGLILSIGLFLQIFLFRSYGIEIGKIDLVQDRDAFGFIWNDYSFLSLFLVTLVPLTWRGSLQKTTKVLYTGTFITASAMTSARTGIVAVIVAYGIVCFVKILRALLTLRIKRAEFYYFGAAILFAPTLIYYVFELFPRVTSLGDSGRVDGYISALHFIGNNILFGSAFGVQYYKEQIDTIPHNAFLYLLAAGGVVFLILFLAWAIVLVGRIYKHVDFGLFLSLAIAGIGFQFIPAFFSAYFFAFLLSLCIIVVDQKNII
ncbi:hypothetical protein [Variovorax sp. J22R115]|uniref:hypothetical protein n=1 Tax=Variovorax sp. J22R115 TaxID=3053509 RepID=UPI002576E86A|nr:hypothetical protein [Variovorax sp. J22R115]MDM0053466.1 hypothetical protein [Variovorax sp. J22R115]